MSSIMFEYIIVRLVSIYPDSGVPRAIIAPSLHSHCAPSILLLDQALLRVGRWSLCLETDSWRRHIVVRGVIGMNAALSLF